MKRIVLITLSLGLALSHFASAENNDEKAKNQKHRAQQTPGLAKATGGNAGKAHNKAMPQGNGTGKYSNASTQAQSNAQWKTTSKKSKGVHTRVYPNNPASQVTTGNVSQTNVRQHNNGSGYQNWQKKGTGGNQNWQKFGVQSHAHWDRTHHDRSWYRSHYSRFARFGGGYYYWNGGFWYPAYGYDPYFTTYVYDAPVYGYNDLDPGQVIANVQAQLQRAGYYRGVLDGLFGPMTRRALLDYQADNGLPVTGEIDEATLYSLGLQ